MKIGTLCYATEQGLGYLAKSFHDVGLVTDVMTVAHGRRRDLTTEWYPGAGRITNLRDRHQYLRVAEFCGSVDAMLFFETPFRWELIDVCRAVGTKTVLMPMYECMPQRWPSYPDAILNPSPLDQRYYPNGAMLPVPVDVWPRKVRTRARVFLHNTGHGGLRGRNGTAELIEASQYLRTPAQILIRSQEHFVSGHSLLDHPYKFRNPNVRVEIGTVPRESLYSDGDVFVFPEKFNGLSLPLQEAAASGMALMTTDRFPNTHYLPPFLKIPVSGVGRARVSPAFVEFDEARIDPRELARVIDATYDTDVESYSAGSLEWAKDRTWERLLPRYREFFDAL